MSDVNTSSVTDEEVLMYVSSESAWENKTLAAVALSGSYSDLLNKPTIDTALSETSTNAVQNKAINVLTRKLWDKVDVVSRLNSEYTASNNYISSSTGNWVSSTTYKHWIVPVDGMRLVSVASNSSSAAQVVPLASYSSTTGTPDYATGYDSIIEIPVGTTLDIPLPEDALYLYVTTGSNDARKPSHIYLTGIGVTEHTGDGSGFITDNGLVAKPVKIYSGTSAPNNNNGSNGDIYIQTTA